MSWAFRTKPGACFDTMKRLTWAGRTITDSTGKRSSCAGTQVAQPGAWRGTIRLAIVSPRSERGHWLSVVSRSCRYPGSAIANSNLPSTYRARASPDLLLPLGGSLTEQEFRAGVPSTYAARFAAVRARVRNSGQRSLELAVWNAASEKEAEESVQTVLTTIIERD